MKAKRSLQDLVRDAGLPFPERQPCLPAPTQPVAIASDEDHTLARQMLVGHRRNDPSYRDPSKQLRGMFKSTKELSGIEPTPVFIKPPFSL